MKMTRRAECSILCSRVIRLQGKSQFGRMRHFGNFKAKLWKKSDVPNIQIWIWVHFRTQNFEAHMMEIVRSSFIDFIDDLWWRKVSHNFWQKLKIFEALFEKLWRLIFAWFWSQNERKSPKMSLIWNKNVS